MSTRTEARDRVFELIDGYLADPDSGEADIHSARSTLPDQVIADLDIILKDRCVSYRDGVLIQLGYGFVAPELDLTLRPEGARGMAQHLGAFLSERHVTAAKDAYQNIAKNTDQLARGNFEEFDRLLVWATGADAGLRGWVLKLACAEIAATVRPVLPMPELNRSDLTFSRMTSLLLDLLTVPSGGAYEQFSFAALLHTVVGNHFADQVRAETKSLNASDRSSFAAGTCNSRPVRGPSKHSRSQRTVGAPR